MPNKVFDFKKHEYLGCVSKSDENAPAYFKDSVLLVDGEEYNVSSPDFFDLLREDDIVYINNYGLIRKVYDVEQSSIDLMLTAHCNSNCLMCPMSESSRCKRESGYQEWLWSLIRLLPDHVNHICITGGEPTLNPDYFFDIVSYLKNKYQRTNFQLLTNGRSLSNYDFCLKVNDCLPNNINIGIPLHAAKPHLYDKIAQVDGGFAQAVQGIKNILSFGRCVELRIVVSKLNIKDMVNIAELIVNQLFQVNCVAFMGLEMLGNAIKNINDVWIPYKEAFDYVRPAIDLLCKNGINVMLFNFPLCCVDSKYWFLAKQSITPSKVRFYQECEKCEVKEACCGFFKSTKNVVLTEVEPILK